MLYHFSEDPSIVTFVPRLSKVYPDLPPVVWTIDRQHSPLYYFPRDCPRVAFWIGQNSSHEDINRFFAFSTARMVIAVEGRWMDRIHNAKLYVYHFKPEGFQCYDEGAGYYVSKETTTPLSVKPVGSLTQQLIQANVELRFTPSLYPLHDQLPRSSLHFSMIRMRNALQP